MISMPQDKNLSNKFSSNSYVYKQNIVSVTQTTMKNYQFQFTYRPKAIKGANMGRSNISQVYFFKRKHLNKIILGKKSVIDKIDRELHECWGEMKFHAKVRRAPKVPHNPMNKCYLLCISLLMTAEWYALITLIIW